MTTTEGSLDRVEEIIDEYIALSLDGIFLRPLSPYGFAVKTKQIQKYDAQRWLEFYRNGLRYILDLNRGGRRFFEFYTLLLLNRMMTDKAIGYVDLRSPAGIGLGALVYNYDGKVFASDEGRMLAEMGDNTFELGHVDNATYRSLIMSDKLVSLIGSSLTQSNLTESPVQFSGKREYRRNCAELFGIEARRTIKLGTQRFSARDKKAANGGLLRDP